MEVEKIVYERLPVEEIVPPIQKPLKDKLKTTFFSSSTESNQGQSLEGDLMVASILQNSKTTINNQSVDPILVDKSDSKFISMKTLSNQGSKVQEMESPGKIKEDLLSDGDVIQEIDSEDGEGEQVKTPESQRRPTIIFDEDFLALDEFRKSKARQLYTQVEEGKIDAKDINVALSRESLEKDLQELRDSRS